MLHILLIPFSQSFFMSNILAIFCVLILALCSALCFYQWKMIQKYKSFPSQRLEAKFFLLLTIEKYRNDYSITKATFQLFLNTVKSFREKGICVLWFLTPYVFVYSAELMKDLVNTIDLADKSSVYDINKQVFGNGLIGSKYEVWKIHRKMLNPAFNLSLLKSRIPVLNRNALQLAEKLETVVDKPIDDLCKYLEYCAFHNMADFVLGLKLDDETHMVLIENIRNVLDKASELFISRLAHPWLYSHSLLPLFPAGRKYLKTIDEVDYLVREVLNELIADRQKFNSQDIKCCANIILNLHLQDPSFTERDFRDHVVNLTSAGYDTVAITMLWCFYALSRHPQVQEKAYCEIESLVPDGDITYDDLSRLKYLDCVIKETLRMYPTIPMIGRKVRKDIQCGQYTIPKGSEVIFFIFMLHRDPKVFQEPEKFDPERFMDSSAIRTWMYIPFSAGYKNCIGKTLALMEMKVQLIHVLRRFRITCEDKIDESDLDWTVTVRPKKPIQFLFEKRHSKELS